MENRIDFHHFRRLLQSLENSDTAIRLRMTGESWIDFSTVLLLSEHAMLIQRDGDRMLISNIGNIVEFEINRSMEYYQADRVYRVSYDDAPSL